MENTPIKRVQGFEIGNETLTDGSERVVLQLKLKPKSGETAIRTTQFSFPPELANTLVVALEEALSRLKTRR